MARRLLSSFSASVAPPVVGKREKDLGKMVGGCICLFKERVNVLKQVCVYDLTPAMKVGEFESNL